MRLLILGPLEGYISTAGKIAIARGATVAHADDIEQGLGMGLWLPIRHEPARLDAHDLPRACRRRMQRLFIDLVVCFVLRSGATWPGHRFRVPGGGSGRGNVRHCTGRRNGTSVLILCPRALADAPKLEKLAKLS